MTVEADDLSSADLAADYTAIEAHMPAGRLLRSFWQPVYLSERLPVGKAAPLRILGEEFTLFRGASGKAQVIAPYCAHRGLKLSAGWVEEDCIRCFYHGWKYDASGQCVEQPAEEPGAARSVSVVSYPTREYIGLIFAYFGDGDPPEFLQLDAYESGGLIIAKQSKRSWSFFDQLENSVDEVHFNFVHRRSKFTDVGLNNEIPKLSCEETDYGILRIGRRGDLVRKSQILMPNCMYSMVFEDEKGWAEHLSWRVPVDRHSHISFIVDHVYKEGAEAEEYQRIRKLHREMLAKLEPAETVINRILAGELHIDEVPPRPDMVLIQDGVAMKGLEKNRDRSRDRLRASDRQVILLRKLWRREMRAIETGEPIKRWRAPRDLVPVSGAAS